MPLILLTGLAVLLLWSLVARRFERSGAAGPFVLLASGAVIVLVDVPGFAAGIDSETALVVVEGVLAVLLFIDASEVEGGIFGRAGRTLARLVLVALPLSLLLVVFAGTSLMPGLDVFALIVVACAVMPTDFAPAASLLRSERIPASVRRVLNVESGYNDGVVSPLFSMSLAATLALPALAQLVESGAAPGGSEEAELEHDLAEFLAAFFGAVPATVIAIVIGGLLGAVAGALGRWASGRGYADASGLRFVMLLVPLLAFGIATFDDSGVNGFIAAFVAGIMCRLMRTRRTGLAAIPHEELLLVEELGALAGGFVWFVLGAATTLVLLDGIDWGVLLLAVLALTVFRLVPVLVAMLGSPFPWCDRTLIGLLGPRGTATIVFGLVAFNRLPDPIASDVLSVTVFTVVGSVVLHGVVAPFALRRTVPVPERR